MGTIGGEQGTRAGTDHQDGAVLVLDECIHGMRSPFSRASWRRFLVLGSEGGSQDSVAALRLA
ncbi:hypothetical protein D9M68_398070 [compost metagenome]